MCYLLEAATSRAETWGSPVISCGERRSGRQGQDCPLERNPECLRKDAGGLLSSKAWGSGCSALEEKPWATVPASRGSRSAEIEKMAA
ncbi:hypothetical protein NDU88_004448 [Pleurodeles waltl]|uniref:Uncharacterized protein n=1 Tax=Pleurodeles waltl TaxID=8319 RepID=A0AAV7VKF8_PLEWA|nr:hypothetical protein NDU88_004448 [Pleurodeles waltl]